MLPFSPSRPWLRTAAIGAVVAALALGTIITAWQVALARVPKHRATLERLVRAHTGLDVRFNELGLRWGWYGPEAVFRDVELGQPGQATSLLRAPELTVGFDAWRTMQTGQLRAGRVTLVAPEIDLTRPPRPASRRGTAPTNDFVRALRGWQGGRIDVESAAVRVPLGSGSLTLRIPRGTLRRSENVWSANLPMLLPDRLGRTARLALRLEGDPGRVDTLSGRVRFDGERLAFAGWRELLAARTPLARHIPAAGNGNIEVRVTLNAGAIEQVTGELAADDVRLSSLRAPLDVGYLNGAWKLARNRDGWRLEVRDLRAGPDGRNAAPAMLALDVNPARRSAHARIDLVPVSTLLQAVQAGVPQVSLAALSAGGLAHDVDVRWNGNAVAGKRLRAAGNATQLTLAMPSRGFSLADARARFVATDDELALDVDSAAARVEFASQPAARWSGVRFATHIIVRPLGSGWEMTSDRFLAEADDGRVTLAGRISAAGPDAVPQIALQASIADASLDAFRELLFPQQHGQGAAQRRALPAITGGRIENGRLDLAGPLGALPPAAVVQRFEGALAVRDASLAGTDQVPALSGVDAHVAWQGTKFRADVTQGQAAGAQIAAAHAEWSLGDDTPLRLTGRGFGRIEHALHWLEAHPQVQPLVRNAHALDARGDALLEFDATVPAQSSRAPRVRLGLTLDGVRVSPARALPAIDELRGTLVLADGRLRRSTLEGRWLGGPVSLRIAERHVRDESVIEVRADGTFEAPQLARALGLDARDRLRGRAPWLGRLEVIAGKDSKLNGFAETALAGVTSALPEPLSKAGAEALPLRFEIEAAPSAPTMLRVRAGNRMRGVLALAAAASGWDIERAAVRMGGGDPTLPATPVFAIEGRVAQLDLPAWMAVARESRAQRGRAPLQVDLAADTLDIAGRAFDAVQLAAREEAGSTRLELVSSTLAGTVLVPHDVTAEAPVQIQLARLDLPAARADASPGQLVAWLAPAAAIEADGFTWGGRRLGRLSATLRASDERVRIDSVRLAAPTHSLQAAAQCAPELDTCRLEMELTSSDVAQTLRDFGFADDVSAPRGRFAAEVDWQRRPDRPWIASLTGPVSFAIEDGIVRSTAAPAASPFAPFAMPALLAQDVDSAPDTAAGAPPEFAFERLEAAYQLRDGHAYTANLHLDGGTEILARGRVGLVDHDYDQVAWVLQGEERLPAAVRRFGATPQMAAAWLRLRDWLGASEPPESRAVLHLHGSWARPIVGSPAHEEVIP